MRIHLALWQNVGSDKITSVCGIVSTPENFVYPKTSFLSYTEPKDICKTCKKIYTRKPW
jgi:hypothetical protein